MKVEKLFEQENKLVLHVSGVSAAYMNTLRRYMISKVPTMAIDHVEFKTNNSILYDEMLAHRLGLVPLTTDLKTYRLPKEAWNEPTGDPRVEVQLTASVPKVKNTTVVQAKDMETKDKKIAPVHLATPLVKLTEGQDIEFVATARLGTGEEHVKWSPGHVWYKHYPHIKIKKQPKDAQALADAHPNVFTVKSGKLALQDGAAYALPDVDFDPDVIEITYEDTDFILIIESWGQLAPKTIIEQALELYNTDLTEFEKLAKTVKS